MAGIGEWLFGSSNRLKKKPTGTPEQQAFGQNLIQMLNQMSGQGGGFGLAQNYFNNLLQPGSGAYDQFSAPYLQQFNEQILPGIAEKFGGAGALSSSGFGQALGGAASGLQSQLAQLFSQLQGQSAGQQYGQFSNLSNLGLNYQPFAYHEKQGSTGLLLPLLTSMLSGQSGGSGPLQAIMHMAGG